MAPIKFGVGQSVLRKEDDALIRGKGHYTDDFAPTPSLHALVLRSPHAHAKFTINATRARGLPGVAAVLTAEDVGGLGDLPCLFNLEVDPFTGPPYPILAKNVVRHVGDAVAFVVAETVDRARDAIDGRPLNDASAGEPEAVLGWIAIAVKVPSPSAAAAWLEVQLVPVGIALAVATGVPAACVPAKISTVTGAASLAVPWNVGVVSFDGDEGAFSVTVGGSVSTSKVTGALSPGLFLIALVWVAYAVNLCRPRARAGERGAEDHAPPVP